MTQHLQRKTVYLEGNIGSGKATFLALLEQHLSVQALYEPVELWQQVQGIDLLDIFFQDQARWGFAMQAYVLATRMNQLQAAAVKSGPRIQCVERSVFSDRYCFAQNLFDSAKMSQLEFAIYQTMWQREVSNPLVAPCGIIYIKTPADICMQRIAFRSRSEERVITLSYVQALERLHDAWLIKKMVQPELWTKIPVLVLDMSVDIRHNMQKQNEYLQAAAQFLKKIDTI